MTRGIGWVVVWAWVCVGCAGERWSRVEAVSETWAAQETAWAVYADAEGREVVLVAQAPRGEPAYWETCEAVLSGCDAVLFGGVAVEGLSADRGEASRQVSSWLAEQEPAEATPDQPSGLVSGDAWRDRRANNVWADLPEEGAAPPVGTRAEWLAIDHVEEEERVARRNAAVLEGLREVLTEGARRVGVTFEAAYLPGIAEGVEELGFARARGLEWVEAFRGQRALAAGAYPRWGPTLPEAHVVWIDAGVQRAEVWFAGVNELGVALGEARIYDAEGALLRVESLSWAPEEALRVVFDHGRACYFGWEQYEGGIRLRYEDPPEGVRPFRYAGPYPASEAQARGALEVLTLPEGVQWRERFAKPEEL